MGQDAGALAPALRCWLYFGGPRRAFPSRRGVQL